MPTHPAPSSDGYASGVRWSGLQGQPDYWPTAREIAAQRAEVEAQRRSVRGRFLALLNEMEVVYWAETSRARSAFSRGFASSDRAPDPVEVGEAIKALASINIPEAREAVAALADILLMAEVA